ncbi:hypothetical protein PIB30_019743 [Stylosanthes scabra]|uniref:Uncharacterized protein n=1 Tax=Stylosanthes scabra TaxID=79078 RepID=A0ABU6W6T3_9FABA|nr:hypothetical protein [Stylosanthes scabra]
MAKRNPKCRDYPRRKLSTYLPKKRAKGTSIGVALRLLGHRKDDIAPLWYKDPEVEELEIGLMQFATDMDAINMARLGIARRCVELYVVHEGFDDEEIPEIGWMDGCWRESAGTR